MRHMMNDTSSTHTRETQGKVKRKSAGIIPVFDTGNGFRFLLLRAYSHWDFPKGAVEDGESELEAAVRETAEEANLRDLSFPWGTEWFETSIYAKDKVARYYIAKTETKDFSILPNPETGLKEHDEGRWVDYRTLVQMTPPRLRLITDWVGEKLGVADEI